MAFILDLQISIAHLTVDLVAAGRVASLRAGSVPPLGTRGTIVGVYEDACEVLFDTDFTGGTSLSGRCLSGRGLIMSNFQLLNLSKPHAIPASGAFATPLLSCRNLDIHVLSDLFVDREFPWITPELQVIAVSAAIVSSP